MPPSDEPIALQVGAYSGGSGEEEPRWLELGGRRLAVLSVLERWREPAGRFFRVHCQGGRRLLLMCREPDRSWWWVRGREDRA